MQNLILVGSAAVERQAPGVLGRRPSDEDYLTTLPLEEAPPQGDLISGEGILGAYEFSGEVASLDEVYTLKVSHSPWVITRSSWYKHLRDVALLKEAGATLIPELHQVAYQEWERRKGPKRVDLKQDVREFFKSGVRRKYEHDSLHRAVAYHSGSPLFERILAPGESVFPSRRRFEELSEQEKGLLVREEAMVLALERTLIPRGEGSSLPENLIQGAYRSWLQALTTGMSKGWFPQWIIENFPSVAEADFNYWEKFRQSSEPEVFVAPRRGALSQEP